ncbi:MAG TPA: type II toxin-antitoxin system VapB family antitoxin [Micropruina sp.]|nr:type II toxin-antitoxin system VapB family antitoxin [Micropruina sp.]
MVDVYLGGGMGLNIKNERVCELARQASERTGLSQTAVIGEALTAYLAALPDERVERLARIRDLLAEFDAITTPADIEAMRETAAHLYDDQYPTG